MYWRLFIDYQTIIHSEKIDTVSDQHSQYSSGAEQCWIIRQFIHWIIYRDLLLLKQASRKPEMYLMSSLSVSSKSQLLLVR